MKRLQDRNKFHLVKKIIDDLFLISLVLVFLLTSISISALPIVLYILTFPLFIIKMLLFKHSLKNTGIEIFIFIFLLTSLISSIASYFTMEQYGLIYMKNSLIWFYKIAPLFIIFIITVQGGYRRWTKILASSFLLGTVLNSIYIIYKFITNFKYLNIYSDRFCGFIHYAIGTIIPMSFCVAIWLITDKNVRLKNFLDTTMRWLGLIIIIISSLLSLVRNTILGIFTAIIIFLIITKRKLLILILLVFIILTLLVPMTRFRVIDTFYSFDYKGFFWEPRSVKEWRWKLYPIGIDIIKRYPLLGVGPRNVALIISEYRPYSVSEFHPHLHNNFLQIGAERGLIGLSALIALFISIYVALIKNRNKGNIITLGLSALTSFIIVGMFEYNMGQYEAFISLWEVLSIVFLYLYGKEKDE
ncbi:MAG: O-antigen ligase family protein [bacterium]